MSDASGEFIRVKEIYLGDFFGALDIIFSLDDKTYIYTVEQAADGTYCSAFDPDYKHVATEIKRRRRRWLLKFMKLAAQSEIASLVK